MGMRDKMTEVKTTLITWGDKPAKRRRQHVENYTKIDTALLREMIRFCKPGDVANFDITFKNSSNGFKGMAYWSGCPYHNHPNPLITVGIGAGVKFPMIANNFLGRGYIPHLVLDREERIVDIIAHELRHFWQKKHPKGFRVWGARGRFSERDADAYAIRKVREWRKMKNEQNM